jgi:hypothetical protein
MNRKQGHNRRLDMRIVFVVVKNRYQARKFAPWAAAIAKVDGGFTCFESVSDYKTWRNQR